MATILFVLTAADHWTLADGTKQPAGFWAEEAIGPYQVFKRAGYEIAAATPGGVGRARTRSGRVAPAAGSWQRRFSGCSTT